MTQKDAIIKTLEKLGGRARLADIYSHVIKLAEFKSGSDKQATIRTTLQRHPEYFRQSEGKKGFWELVSYQEEIANLREKIANLEVLLSEKENTIVELRGIKTEDDFVERLVDATKNLFGIARKNADYVRQVLLKLNRTKEQEELLAWIERRDQKAMKEVTKKIVQKNINSQVFNGNIKESEFNGGNNNG